MKRENRILLNVGFLIASAICCFIITKNIFAKGDSTNVISTDSATSIDVLPSSNEIDSSGNIEDEQVEKNYSKTSMRLYDKIKGYSDSSDKVQYDYTIIYEFSDTLHEEFSGIVYRELGLKVDSNEHQLVFNNRQNYFAINHVAELAIYSDLQQVRKTAEKHRHNGVLEGIDSADIKSRSMNAMDLSSDVLGYLIQEDKSYEDDEKIVIDVVFNEDSPIMSFFLSFDKKTRLTDSMIVDMLEIVDVDPNMSSEEESEMSVYYNDLMAYERQVTFKARNFINRERADLKNLDKKYIAKVGKGARLKRNKNYNLTILN